MFKFIKNWLTKKPAAKEQSIAKMAALALALGQMSVKTLADSVNAQGQRLTTFQLKYPRFFHAEFMTHRRFGRNASSSRAIPVKKILAQVWKDPATPLHWGKNQGGMQAHAEIWGFRRFIAKVLWRFAGRCACVFAWMLHCLGVHKQVVNRILEPWQFIHVIVSATEYENFFELRDHEDAQPEFHVLAYLMRIEQQRSTPELLMPGQWHLPYITHAESCNHPIEILKQVSAARCCRVSYLNHDGELSSVDADLALCNRLVGAEPLHASPFEHQATPDEFDTRTELWKTPAMHGNLLGWNQYRKYIEVDTWLKKEKANVVV